MSKLNNTQLPNTLSSKTIDNTNAINTNLTQLSISGGSGSQVLSTNGSGVLNWITASGGGSFPTTETIANGTIDITKSITYVTGNNVTLPASTSAGQYKTIIKLNDNASVNYVFSSPTGSTLFDPTTNTVILVGTFASIQYPYNVVGCNKICRYDPTTNTISSIGGGVITGNEIYRAKFDSLGRLWVVGDFTNIGGTACSNIAYWNGTNWVAGNVGTINGQVRQIIFDTANPSNYWICGGFTTANGVTVNRFAYFNGTTYVGYGTGLTASFAFEMMQNNTSNDIFIVGNVGSANGVANTGRVVKFTPVTNVFSTVSASNYITGGDVFSVYVENGKVYLAGSTIQIFNQIWNSGAVYYNGTSWVNMGTGSLLGQARGIKKVNGYVTISGGFSSIATNPTATSGSTGTINASYFVRFDEVNNRLQSYYSSTSFGTLDFSVDTSGNLWVALSDGICKITPDNLLTINATSTIFAIPFFNSSVRSNNFKGIQFNQKNSMLTLISDNSGNWASAKSLNQAEAIYSLENYA